MSRDFASFMSTISEESAEERINELMEILEKVMLIISNSVDSMTGRLVKLENNINTMMGRVYKIETMPVVAAPAAAPGAPVPAPAATAPPPPKPAPKPMSPVSARSALQSELKQLFARRKQQ